MLEVQTKYIQIFAQGTSGGCFDSGVDHYVLWFKIKHNEKLVDHIIQLWSRHKCKKVLYWFENPVYMRSVPGLSHVHVFCKSPHFSYAKQLYSNNTHISYATMESNRRPNVPNVPSVRHSSAPKIFLHSSTNQSREFSGLVTYLVRTSATR